MTSSSARTAIRAFVLVPHQPAIAHPVELLILGGLVLILLLLIVTAAVRAPSSQLRSRRRSDRWDRRRNRTDAH
jgi:hypothetical protein